jgi:hypothetical protein
MNVFLSYENSNRPFIDDQLIPFLKELRVDPLIMDLQLVIGASIESNRDTRLSQLLRECEFIIVVLSREYVRSPWLRKELLAFQKLEAVRRSDLLLPVVLDNCRVPVELKGRICADFRQSIEQGFEKLGAYILESRRAFIVMRFGDGALNSAYKRVIKPVFKEFSYSPLRIDEKKRSAKISIEILDEIRRSEIIFADLSGKRPNCYYEAGYAQALGKEVILSIRKEDFPPDFDMHDYRFIIWDNEDELENQLKEVLEEIRLGTIEITPKSSMVQPAVPGVASLTGQPVSPNKGAAPDANRASRGRRQ